MDNTTIFDLNQFIQSRTPDYHAFFI
jgi:hypothetical protein